MPLPPTFQLPLFAIVLTCTLPAQNTGGKATLIVPATSNPYLAGMPRGTFATWHDHAPEQSPVLVELSLANAVAVTFQATGKVEHAPYDPPQFDPPNGSVATTHHGHAEHGISDITAPINSLLGVFLDDDRPDRAPAPDPFNLHGAARNLSTLSPKLKQLFFIGTGCTEAGMPRRYLVPIGATRLFLGTMDGEDWWNNQGYFMVTVTVERGVVSSNMFSVDSRIFFADWSCLPDRSQCTPDRPIIQELDPGKYHVVVAAQSEWGASIPTPPGATATIHGATGIVCLDSESRSTSSCNGPLGNGAPADAEFLAPQERVGALVSRTTGGRTYFSVNDRHGAAFLKHEGYFEFDVTIK